jgi:hypothetical protein
VPFPLRFRVCAPVLVLAFGAVHAMAACSEDDASPKDASSLDGSTTAPPADGAPPSNPGVPDSGGEGGMPVGSTCRDGATDRAVVKPPPGALVITEVLPKPLSDSGDTEWFEITNTGTAAFDLNGLGLQGSSTTTPAQLVMSSTCKSVAPGAFALFARTGDAISNGGLPEADALFGFSLLDGTGSVRVLDGATVLDEISWSAPPSAKSLQLDPEAFDTVANDSATSFCESSSLYGTTDNQGTPKAANVQCP